MQPNAKMLIQQPRSGLQVVYISVLRHPLVPQLLLSSFEPQESVLVGKYIVLFVAHLSDLFL